MESEEHELQIERARDSTRALARALRAVFSRLRKDRAGRRAQGCGPAHLSLAAREDPQHGPPLPAAEHHPALQHLSAVLAAHLSRDRERHVQAPRAARRKAGRSRHAADRRRPPSLRQRARQGLVTPAADCRSAGSRGARGRAAVATHWAPVRSAAVRIHGARVRRRTWGLACRLRERRCRRRPALPACRRHHRNVRHRCRPVRWQRVLLTGQ